MFKRLKTLKDLLWALGIALCLLALLVGLISNSFTRYYGDREIPKMNLRSGIEERQQKRTAEKAAREAEQQEEPAEDFVIYGNNGEEATPAPEE